MAGARQPVELLMLKGKKNLTKKEIEERKKTEVKAPNDKVKAPKYLSPELKKEFRKISSELIEIGIMSNLDCDALARFLLSQKMYVDVTEELLKQQPVKQMVYADEDGNLCADTVHNTTYAELLNMQDKLFKQARAAATDLGLTISSRCKLVVPKKEEEDAPKSDAEKKFGGKL